MNGVREARPVMLMSPIGPSTTRCAAASRGGTGRCRGRTRRRSRGTPRWPCRPCRTFSSSAAQLLDRREPGRELLHLDAHRPDTRVGGRLHQRVAQVAARQSAVAEELPERRGRGAAPGSARRFRSSGCCRPARAGSRNAPRARSASTPITRIASTPTTATSAFVRVVMVSSTSSAPDDTRPSEYEVAGRSAPRRGRKAATKGKGRPAGLPLDSRRARFAAGYFAASRLATIFSISSIAQFICASSARYGAGVARSTPASLSSSYG